MGKSILITGGARSGKSRFAESLATQEGRSVLYVATSIPFDEEMKKRILKHQQSRPTDWKTYEGYRHIGNYLKNMETSYDVILIDCITIMITNLLFDFIDPFFDMDKLTMEQIQKVEEKIQKEIQLLLEEIEKISSTVIMVTNELGSGIVPESKLGRVFRDIAGRVNQQIAQKVDKVYLTVCGIPMQIK
ncbi:MAG: bifunctional adenosylcobinamide kinase/adenosylcobinamide-phosphate guanylyltransferase [Epulopiscium sp.]|nr:bifunctional adenosylcobinamide kinase/adenosylcobinamide-phosphate guanylyltransferase [Candidatus Epulonipiscium sp.]